MNTGYIPPKAAKAAVVFAWLFSAPVWAADNYVYDAIGKVSVFEGKNAAHAVVKNDLIPSDTVVNSGDKSYAVLKFKDGQVAAMQANTAFRFKEYLDDSNSAEKGEIMFSKFTGGMHFITSLLGQPNHKAFRLSTPNATIGIHATEFLVATRNNALYSRVISGSISMSNEAGVTVFTAGQTILAESPNTLPVAIPSAALPPGIFSQLNEIPTPPATPAPAPETGTASAGAITSVSTTGTPSARTVSITGAGATYTGANLPCDFCTGRTNTVATHVATDTAADAPVTGEADLFNTHNLTPTGANTGEICAFCRTPQGAESNVSAPRWNRTLTTLSSYRAFVSLGSAAQEATGSISIACLSCHDGSQAPNIAINTPTLRLDVGNVNVNIGNALRNHHPVGIQYGGGGQNQYAPDVISNPTAAYIRLMDMNKFANPDKFESIYINRRFQTPRVFSRKDKDAFGDVLTFSKEGDFDSPNSGGFNKSTYSGNGSGTVWWVKLSLIH